ncbi:MAG: oligosaccharide flippase family protein, partial [Ignavibacteriales bacterium]|nr:oligosaccharide flippase family protein [Ignavibacteriales bacterium]
MKHHSKNLLSLVGYDAGTRLLGFVTTAYIARIVGNEGFGVLNYAMAFLSYAFLLASPGLHTVGTRAASRRDSAEGYLVSDVSNVRLLLSVVVGIVMSVGAVYGTGNVELRTIILLYSASLIPYALQLEWFFQGKEDVQTIGLYRFIAGAAYLAAVLLMLHSRADLATVPVAFLIAAVVNAAALFILFRKRYAGALPGRSLKVLRLRWRKILAESLP